MNYNGEQRGNDPSEHYQQIQIGQEEALQLDSYVSTLLNLALLEDWISCAFLGGLQTLRETSRF